jgi:hypothetical protein
MLFLSWLSLMFIGLKLTGYIDWSWFLVFLPEIIQVIVAAIIKTLTDLKNK